MFKLIFYLSGILFAFYKNKNFKHIKDNVKKTIENNSKEKISIKINTDNINHLPEEQKKMLKDSVLAFLFFVWMLIGLLTFQWILFAGVLLIGILTNWLIKRFFETNLQLRILISQLYVIITWILCIITAFNAYLFKISSNEIIQFFTYYGK